MGFARDFRAGIQGFIPLSFNVFLNRSSSWPRSAKSRSAEGRLTKKRGRARVIADLTRRHEEADRTAIGIGDGAQLGVHAAVLRGAWIPRINASSPWHSADQATSLVVRPSAL